MKRILRLDRFRLRGLSGVRDEVLLTATAQNLRRIAKLLCRAPPPRTAIVGIASGATTYAKTPTRPDWKGPVTAIIGDWSVVLLSRDTTEATPSAAPASRFLPRSE